MIISKYFLLGSLVAITGISVLSAQTTTWVEGAVDPTDWDALLNWNNGVPTTTTVANLVFPAGDADDILISSSASAKGIIYGANLTYSSFLTTGSGASLTIGTSGITNSSSLQIGHKAETILSASSTFDPGASGMVMEKALSVGANTLTVASNTGTLVLQAGTSFAVDSSSIFGRVAGTGLVQYSGALNFDFSYTASAGSWDFFAQSPTGSIGGTGVALSGLYSLTFTESTPGLWTGTAGGLDWSYTESTGVLAAVPEPTTWALLATGLTTMMVFRPRRRQH